MYSAWHGYMFILLLFYCFIVLSLVNTKASDVFGIFILA
jgi:hypothetical protein